MPVDAPATVEALDEAIGRFLDIHHSYLNQKRRRSGYLKYVLHDPDCNLVKPVYDDHGSVIDFEIISKTFDADSEMYSRDDAIALAKEINALRIEEGSTTDHISYMETASFFSPLLQRLHHAKEIISYLK